LRCPFVCGELSKQHLPHHKNNAAKCCFDDTVIAALKIARTVLKKKKKKCGRKNQRGVNAGALAAKKSRNPSKNGLFMG